ncbi:MAG: sigma-E processing peptidase SpoIIGA [Clostridia bacterium]|jgi:sigma-E processing peptidase SpoIIGA|nr:sigma-E processing peptidase SpoIIGA [Clostridia bacterium]MCI2000165.1 sigma-E processing peptidase SpoIIGA [Clostridia bacterium]MCI2014670.1 sigma-E processing peptidase SpoIIGA [Clostridia bacterium]
MTLYADKIFIEGFIMDVAILYFVSVISRTYLKLKKIIIFAALGALAEVILMCIFVNKPILYILSALLANICVSWLLFKPKSIYGFFKIIALTMLFSALLYGLLVWIKKMSNLPESVMYYFKNYGPKNSIFVFIITSGLAFLFFNLAGKWKESAFSNRQDYCKLKMLYTGKTIETDALIDTGCFISDSKSGAVVIPAENTAIINLLPDSQREDFLIGCYDKNDRISYINFSSLGAANGEIPVLKLDCAEAVFSDGKSIKFQNAEAAVFNGRFSSSGGYHAIISRRDIDIWRQRI